MQGALDALPPSLRAAAPVMRPAALAAALDLFGTARTAGRPALRVYIDTACGMPDDWSSWWQVYLNASRRSSKSRAVRAEAKYVADAYVLHMLAASPFVVQDWRTADASVVALLPRRYGGAGIAAERCRRKLTRESEAWRATGGARHFFVLTSDRGPCCNSGSLISVAFAKHHVIGHHGEAEGHRWRHEDGPDAPCFHGYKDISIPTPNFVRMWRPRRGRAAARHLLVYYAGSGQFYLPKRQKGRNEKPTPGIREGRRIMHEVWGNRSQNPDIRVSSLAASATYWSFLERAKFCPVMGGFAPWSPRLTEAVFAGCVPVIFSSMLPPFSRLLDWSLFSVRVPSLHDIRHLREILARQDHAKLSANLDAASHALWYGLEGEHASAEGGMLLFLLMEMHLVLKEAARRPLVDRVQEVFGPLPTTPLRPRANRHGTRQNETFYYEGQVVVSTSRGGIERAWDCVYMQNNRKARHASDPEETFETGNLTQTKMTMGYECLCRRQFDEKKTRSSQRFLEPISPTQRDLGKDVCTGPCPALYCGETDPWTDRRAPPRPQCVGCEKDRNCTLAGGNAQAHKGKNFVVSRMAAS